MIERACGNGSPAELLPRALVGFGWRRGLRGRSWLEGQRRVESRQRRAQRIQAWGAGKAVVFDDATNCRCYAASSSSGRSIVGTARILVLRLVRASAGRPQITRIFSKNALARLVIRLSGLPMGITAPTRQRRSL